MVCIDFPTFLTHIHCDLARPNTTGNTGNVHIKLYSLQVSLSRSDDANPASRLPSKDLRQQAECLPGLPLVSCCSYFFQKQKLGEKKNKIFAGVTFKSFLKEIKGRMMQESYNDSPQEPRCSGSVAPFGRSHLGCCNHVDTCHAIPYQKLPFRPRCYLKHTRSPWRYGRSGAQKKSSKFWASWISSITNE